MAVETPVLHTSNSNGTSADTLVFTVQSGGIAAGKDIIIAVCARGFLGPGAGATHSVSDSSSNTYNSTVEEGGTINGDTVSMGILHCVNCTALSASDTITVTWDLGDASDRAGGVIVTDKIDSTDIVHGTNSSGGESTTYNSGSVADIPAGALAIGLLSYRTDGPNATLDSDYTSLFDIDIDSLGAICGYRIPVSQESNNFTDTISATARWRAGLGTFNEEPGDPTVSGPIMQSTYLTQLVSIVGY